MPEEIILELPWVVFHGFLSQIRSNLHDIFTSEAVQNNASHTLRLLVWSQKLHEIKLVFWLNPSSPHPTSPQHPHSPTPKLKLLRRYKVVVSFMSIAFVVVKLKIFRVLGTHSAPMKWPFWVFLGLSSPRGSNLGEILNRERILADKNTV